MALIRILKPKNLSRTEFIKLVQDEGGMDDASLAACKEDAQLKPLWVKLELADEVHKNNPNTLIGLQALDSLGYLTNRYQAVLDAWPEV